MNNKQNEIFDSKNCPQIILIRKYKSNGVNKDLNTQIQRVFLFLQLTNKKNSINIDIIKYKQYHLDFNS